MKDTTSKYHFFVLTGRLPDSNMKYKKKWIIHTKNIWIRFWY